MLKYALLGFLNYDNKTGYELKQTMDRSTNHFWHAKQSQIYQTLKKLEADGLVVSHPEHQESRPDRRVYAITDSGKQAMAAWLAKPVTTLEPNKQLLLLKLFFSGGLGKESLLTQLRLLRKLHEQQLDLYKTESPNVIKQHGKSDPELNRDTIMWESTRRFGELHEIMYIDWLDETIRMIAEHF